MKTIVWRPGYDPTLVRPTTAQRGTPLAGQPLAGQEIGSVQDTLVVATPGDVYEQILAWGGDCELVIDTSLAPAILPRGMVLPGFGVDPVTGAALTRGHPLLSIKGATRNLTSTTLLTVSDTAQILGLAGLTDMALSCEARTVVPLAIGERLDMERSTIANAVGSFLPCIQTNDDFHGVLRADNRCFLDNSGAALPIVKLGRTPGGAACQWSICATMGFVSGPNPDAVAASHPAVSSCVFFHDASIAVGAFAAANPALTVIDQIV